MLINTQLNANIQLVMNSFGTLFPDNSLTVNIIADISLTCFKFPDISRFSSQVVTLNYKSKCQFLVPKHRQSLNLAH